jgi:hypothetical protein
VSYIAIHVYNGDPEEFIDSEEAATIGRRVVERVFDDGEELDAAAAIAGYVAERKHFDVRVWTN